MKKLYPNRWKLPLWKLIGPPFSDPGEAFLQVVLEGPEPPPARLVHVESGKAILLKASRQEPGGFRVAAKGLLRPLFRAGDRLLDAAYPAQWRNEGLFVPQGAMNRGWDLDRATLLGPLVRTGGVPVQVRTLDGGQGKRLLHLRCRGVLLLPGAFYWIEHGDRRLDLALLAFGPFREKDLGLLGRRAFRFPGLLSVRAIYSVNLRHRGFVLLPPELHAETFEEALGTGEVRIMRRTLDFWKTRLARRAKLPGGLSPTELEREAILPAPVVRYVAEALVAEGRLVEDGGRYRSTIDPQRRLSPYARSVWKRLGQRALVGLHANALTDPIQKRGMEELVQLGLAVDLGEGWYLSDSSLREVVDRLRAAPTGPWDLHQLRDLLPASRSYLMALLQELVRRRVLTQEGARWRLEP